VPVVSTSGAVGSVRVDPHGFNDAREFGRFLDRLDRTVTGGL
jgi:hypothetical protein